MFSQIYTEKPCLLIILCNQKFYRDISTLESAVSNFSHKNPLYAIVLRPVRLRISYYAMTAYDIEHQFFLFRFTGSLSQLSLLVVKQWAVEEPDLGLLTVAPTIQNEVTNLIFVCSNLSIY